jgi:hypothetical protein
MMKAIASPSSVVCTVSPYAHEPEKRKPVLPKASCSNNQLKRDRHSSLEYRALKACRLSACAA